MAHLQVYSNCSHSFPIMTMSFSGNDTVWNNNRVSRLWCRDIYNTKTMNGYLVRDETLIKEIINGIHHNICSFRLNMEEEQDNQYSSSYVQVHRPDDQDDNSWFSHEQRSFVTLNHFITDVYIEENYENTDKCEKLIIIIEFISKPNINVECTGRYTANIRISLPLQLAYQYRSLFQNNMNIDIMNRIIDKAFANQYYLPITSLKESLKLICVDALCQSYVDHTTSYRFWDNPEVLNDNWFCQFRMNGKENENGNENEKGRKTTQKFQKILNKRISWW